MLANFLMGVALYGSVFILPQYLARIQGYNSEQIGMVLAWTGLPQLVLIPLVPRLMKRFDARLVIGVGFALFAASNFMNIYMTTDYGSDQLFWPNVVRAVGQALAFAPLSAVATAGIEAENAGSASGLFNMMRNLGGAVGIAMLQTFLTKREQYHSNVLTPVGFAVRTGDPHPASTSSRNISSITASPIAPMPRTAPSSPSAMSCRSRPLSWPSATLSI